MNLFPGQTLTDTGIYDSDFDLRGVVDTSPYPIFIHNQGIAKYANTLAKKLVKLSEADDIVGLNIAAFVHADDLPKLQEVLMKQNQSPRISDTMEFRIIDPDGGITLLHGKSTAVKYGGELCRLFHVYNFDKVEQEIKESRAELMNYRTFQEKVNNTSPVLVTIFEIEKLTSIYRNKDIVKWFGYTPDTFPMQTINLVHPEYQDDVRKSIAKVAQMSDHEIETTVYPFVTGDGHIKFILTRSAVFQRDDAGEATHILMAHSDITDLKETESKLDKSEGSRKAILYAIPDMLAILNDEGVIVDFYPNELMRRAMKGTVISGKSVSEFISGEQREELMELVMETIKQNALHTYHFEYESKGKVSYYEIRISPLSRTEVVILARDMSEPKMAKDKIDHYNQELFAKNQELERYITSNSELEKFAYIASHDLREPLRSLIGFAQLLQKRNAGKLTPESEEFIENIIHGGQRMNTLLSSLLEYSRIASTGKPFSNVSVTDVIKKVRSDLRVAFEENKAELILFDLPSLYCDELQMRQLFQNLISNSIKFRGTQAPIIKISAEKNDRYWLFKVEDNGIGIDMKHKDKVFQIFSRLHSQDKYQGSGIGLSVCKKIVERHSGKIWLESTLGRGTTIYFTVLL